MADSRTDSLKDSLESEARENEAIQRQYRSIAQLTKESRERGNNLEQCRKKYYGEYEATGEFHSEYRRLSTGQIQRCNQSGFFSRLFQNSGKSPAEVKACEDGISTKFLQCLTTYSEQEKKNLEYLATNTAEWVRIHEAEINRRNTENAAAKKRLICKEKYYGQYTSVNESLVKPGLFQRCAGKKNALACEGNVYQNYKKCIK